MNFSNKKIQKIIAFTLILSFIVPMVMFSKPKRAEAWIPDWLNAIFNSKSAVQGTIQTGIQSKDLVFTTKDFLKEIAKEILRGVARRFLQQMTKSTINWINSGFHGKPLFVENPDSFFRDIAKYEVRSFVDTIGYNSLRYPFGRDAALNAIYTFKARAEDRLAYSLSGVTNDQAYLNSYRNDFSVGGWDGYIINSQFPQNNPYGFRILAGQYLNSKTTAATNKINQTLDRGLGFLSPQVCATNPSFSNLTNPWNPPKFTKPAYTPPAYDDGESAEFNQAMQAQYNQQYETTVLAAQAEWATKIGCPNKPDGTSGFTATTPGYVVANQITNAMGSQFRQSELAYAMGNSISQIVDALVSKFMNDGLTALASKVNTRPQEDNWDYYGNSLGVVQPYNKGAWDSGPDEIVTVADLKKAVSDGITNTALELGLMKQLLDVLGATWPDVRNLDFCTPGPDLNWETRLLNETQRNSQKLYEKESDNDGDKAAAATRVLKQLEYAISIFQDWIKRNALLELPNSPAYLEEVRNVGKISMLAEQYLDNKSDATLTLARLNSLKTNLVRLTSEPAPGSSGEKLLVTLKKQYDALRNSVSNPYSIEDTRNQLNIAKDHLDSIRKMITECRSARTTAGWDLKYDNGRGESRKANTTALGGKTSTGGNTTILGSAALSQEKQLFCGSPIKSGFSHGEEDSSSFGLGGLSGSKSATYIFNNPTNPAGIPPYQDVAMVNAKDVFHWTSVWRAIFTFGFGGRRQVDIAIECGTVWRSNITDYKGSVPGVSRVTEGFNGSSATTGSSGGSGPMCSLPSVPVVAPTLIQNPATPTIGAGYLGRPQENGWWPNISPDGRFITFGNFGGSYVYEFATGQLTDMSNPPGLPQGGRCTAGSWITNNKLSIWCDSIGVSASGWYRYEANVGEWIPRLTSDDPAMVGGYATRAADGHWASVLNSWPGISSSKLGIRKDNKVIASAPPSGATHHEGVGLGNGIIGISDNLLAAACDNTNEQICVWEGSKIKNIYDAQVTMWGALLKHGYIIYGGGPIHGITPDGEDIDLSVLKDGGESVGTIFLVDGKIWIATISYDNPDPVTKYGHILLRPWGSTNAVAVRGEPAGQLDIVQNGQNLRIAFANDVGHLTVVTVPISTLNAQLSSPQNSCISSSSGSLSQSCEAKPVIDKTATVSGGTFPDPAIYNGRAYLAVQEGAADPNMKLYLYSFAMDLTDKKTIEIPTSGIGRYFQRVTVYNNVLWVAFREGANSTYRIKLWRSDTGTVEDLGAGGFGNRPVAVGNGRIVWTGMSINDGIKSRALTGGTVTNLGPITGSTGLARVLPDGSVVTYDEDLNAVPWGVSASFSGPVAVATDAYNLDLSVIKPGDDNGVVGRINDDPASQFNIWPTERAHDPRVASDSSGNFVVTTWNPTVRIAVGKTNNSCVATNESVDINTFPNSEELNAVDNSTPVGPTYTGPSDSQLSNNFNVNNSNVNTYQSSGGVFIPSSNSSANFNQYSNTNVLPSNSSSGSSSSSSYGSGGSSSSSSSSVDGSSSTYTSYAPTGDMGVQTFTPATQSNPPLSNATPPQANGSGINAPETEETAEGKGGLPTWLWVVIIIILVIITLGIIKRIRDNREYQ